MGHVNTPQFPSEYIPQVKVESTDNNKLELSVSNRIKKEKISE